MSVINATSGGEVFLQTNFLTIGINAQGTIGTRYAAPTQFSTDAEHGYTRVGLYADTDGFGQGKATTSREAVLPGTAIETFAIGYKIDGTKNTATNSGLDGMKEVTGKLTNSSSAKVGQAVWDGTTAQNLDVHQVVTMTEDGKYARFDVTLTNDSAKTMTDVQYLRSIDPDMGSTYATYNKIVAQGNGSALVTASAAAGTDPLFLYANDSRATVSIYGFENFNPYSASVLAAQAQGFTKNADVSLNLNYALGDLKPGQSTTITFYLGMTNDLNSTVAEINKLPSTPPSTGTPDPVNVAPVAYADTADVDAGKTVVIKALANDKDANGDGLTAALVTGPAHGTVKANADGTFSYTADAGYSGKDSFTYAASDGSLSSTATVTIGVNGKPIVAADSAAVDAGKSVVVNVLANDRDPDGDALKASLVTGPAHGTVKENADGTFSYTADAGYSGKDSFTYAASDGSLSSNGTVTVTVNGKPVAADDSASADAGKAVTINVLANDSDPEATALKAAIVTGPAHGTVKANADGTFSYTADAGYSGKDSFTYSASDGSLSGNATVTIDVNGKPVALADAASVDTGKSVTIKVLANDTDPNGDALKAALVNGPANGTIKLNADGTFTYTPKAGYVGTDSFTYSASDGSLSSNAAVLLTVNAVTAPNNAPTAMNDAASVNAGINFTGNVLTNDSDIEGTHLTAALVTGPAHGTLVLNADGKYSYTADAGYSGKDSFTYAASDGSLSSKATVTIDVNGRPTANADKASVDAGKSVTVKVLANDTDPNGDTLEAALVTGPSHGTVKAGANGTFIYTADAGYSGKDSFVYSASDGGLLSNATVTVDVNGKPVAAADSASVDTGKSVTINVLANDKDADGDALTASLVSGPAHGTIKLNADGSFTYKADAGYSGKDSFVYAASDGSLSNNATVSLDVKGLDAPRAPGEASTMTAAEFLAKAGTIDLSSKASSTVSGVAAHNSFFVDSTGVSGSDVIQNFGRSDLLVTKTALYDSNADGFIAFRNNKLSIDAGGLGSDAVTLKGVSTLRHMGEVDGLSIYANNADKPNGAFDSKIGNDVFSGDTLDKAKQIFFFDTALDLDLGDDTINKFGTKDILVTTSALKLTAGTNQVDFASDHLLHLVGGNGAADDLLTPGEGGYVAINDTKGAVVDHLEFDGSLTSYGVTYYVYSLVGSGAGLDSLGL